MDDWNRLGLPGPTEDLTAIKRAYALKLRVTRPDDDAAAYQALREAYVRAQTFARWRQERAAFMPAETPAELAEATIDDLVAPAAEMEPPPDAHLETMADEARCWPTPEALCGEVVEAHRRSRQALEALLPTLQQQLLDLPLTHQTEASVRFADLVLQQRRLPEALLQMLQRHFGWLDDFRTARILGHERAEGLRDMLGELERDFDDPFTQRQHAETLAVHALFTQGRQLRATLVALLMGVHLRTQMERAGVALLRRMGVGAPSQAWLRRVLSVGDWVRAAAVVCLVFPLGWALTGNADRALGGMLGALAICAAGPLLVLTALGVIQKTQRLAKWPPSLSARFGLHRWRGAWPWIGIAALVIAGWLDMESPEAFVGTILLVLFGLAAAMPETTDQGFVALSLWAFTVAALHLSQPIEFGLAAAWVLAGMWLNLQRGIDVGAAFDGWWSTGGGSVLAPLALATVGLPALWSWAARRMGFRVVVAALVLASTPVLMHAALKPWYVLPAAPVLALGLLVSLQRFGLYCGRRLTVGMAAGAG